MNENHKKIILKHVAILLPPKRKPIHTPEYYLTNIINLVNDFNSWRSLTKSIDIKQENPQHYKSAIAL
jgi:hypothetical protein